MSDDDSPARSDGAASGIAEAPASRPRGAHRRIPVVHPALFAAWPVLLLYAVNLEEVAPRDLFGPLALAVAGAAGVTLIAGLLLRSLHRAAVVASALAVLFFSYGHASRALGRVTVAGIALGSGRALLAVWAAAAVAAGAVAARAARRLPATTTTLNLASAALVATAVVPVVAHAITVGSSPVLRTSSAPAAAPQAGPHEHRRDVYYIVMDRYGGRQTLREHYDFDNAPFYRWLRRRGFFVADESLANYPKTAHSLASSLTMDFLGSVTERAGETSADYRPLYRLIQRSTLATLMQSMRYRYIHMGSWWEGTRHSPIADENLRYDSMSEFSRALYDTTPLPAIAEAAGLGGRTGSLRVREYHRVLWQFRALAEVSRRPEPTFTFAHILLPHEPLVFDRDGNFVPESVVRTNGRAHHFIEQVRFANRKLRKLLTGLLAGPDDRDPIIVLQADEGPHPLVSVAGDRWIDADRQQLEQKLRILNAVYLPGSAASPLEHTITPVNTWRVVLNEAFGARLPLRRDDVYVWEDERHLYRFHEVTRLLRRR